MIWLIFAIISSIVFSFILGWNISKHKFTKKLIENYDFGEIIIDMSGYDKELISCDFSKNPKEMLAYNYILLQVKVRK